MDTLTEVFFLVVAVSPPVGGGGFDGYVDRGVLSCGGRLFSCGGRGVRWIR